VNRHQRRAQARRQAKAAAGIRAVMSASEADGKPWHVHGMTDACRDCGATASLSGQGRNGQVLARIYHDDGCPASLGVTSWQPVPL
jgi:hypothetical protein